MTTFNDGAALATAIAHLRSITPENDMWTGQDIADGSGGDYPRHIDHAIATILNAVIRGELAPVSPNAALPAGMSLRDWFAGQAMSGWLASFGPDEGYRAAGISTFAYEIADAMITARSGGQSNE